MLHFSFKLAQYFTVNWFWSSLHEPTYERLRFEIWYDIILDYIDQFLESKL
jgi:hypothetical protein